MIKIKAIILTLEKYPERLNNLQTFIKELESIGITVEIYYGVDGNEITIREEPYSNGIFSITYKDDAYFYDRTKRLNGQPMKKGEFGCAWSHRNIYKKLKDDDQYDKYIVFEDDVERVWSLENFSNILCNLPEDFDLLHIAESQWYPFHKIKKVEGKDFYIPYKRFFNITAAYILSKKGAIKILKYAHSFMNVPADDLISDMYVNSDLNMYVPENFIFTQNRQIVSTIDTINNK